MAVILKNQESDRFIYLGAGHRSPASFPSVESFAAV